jgi:hypothetical protein
MLSGSCRCRTSGHNFDQDDANHNVASRNVKISALCPQIIRGAGIDPCFSARGINNMRRRSFDNCSSRTPDLLN